MYPFILESKKWKDRANTLLREKELVEKLSLFGKVHFTGAYLYDLMMHGDIDISVIREKVFSKEEVLAIFNSFYSEGKFRSYFIGGDWDDPRKGNEFPEGYYVGLKEKVDGETWKIDIWFFSEEEFKNRPNMTELQSIDDEKKNLILECKQYKKDNSIKITGKEIYTSVLSGEVKSIEALLVLKILEKLDCSNAFTASKKPLLPMGKLQIEIP